MVAQQDGTGAHSFLWNLQSARFERLGNQFTDYLIRCEEPRFIHQFCQRNLATACPGARCSRHHAMWIVEENFDIEVVMHKRPRYSCQRQVDPSLPQLPKVQRLGVCLDHADNDPRMASRQLAFSLGREGGYTLLGETLSCLA